MKEGLMTAAAIVFAATVPASVALPNLNGKFCATAAATSESEDGSLRKNYFDLCIDSADMKTGKVWEVIRSVTHIEDGSYTTTLLSNGQCSAQPIGPSGSFLSQEAFHMHSDATLNETKDGKQTWVHAEYKNWDGPDHTCRAGNDGTTYTTIWGVSEQTVDGMQDLLTKSVLVEQCISGKWHFQQNMGYDLTDKYTRVVDVRKFERPPSYCYDAHHWVQNYRCTTTKYVPYPGGGKTITIDGCDQREGNYDGCCARENAKPQCGNIKNCTALIYGQAYPSFIQI